MVDPGDAGSVGAALALEVQRAGAGPQVRPAAPPVAIAEATSTWVWFVELAGEDLPPDLRRPMVLRIYRPEEQRVADREHDLTRFLAAGGYPAPAPFLHGDGSGPLAHPWVLQARLPGTTALDVVSRRPWSIRRLVEDLGALQARLHGSDADASPLPHDGPVSERYLVEDLDRRRRNVRAHETSDGLGWLHSSAGAYADRETVLCHGDFHARNVLVDHGGPTTTYGVVDWTDARTNGRPDGHSTTAGSGGGRRSTCTEVGCSCRRGRRGPSPGRRAR